MEPETQKPSVISAVPPSGDDDDSSVDLPFTQHPSIPAPAEPASATKDASPIVVHKSAPQPKPILRPAKIATAEAKTTKKVEGWYKTKSNIKEIVLPKPKNTTTPHETTALPVASNETQSKPEAKKVTPVENKEVTVPTPTGNSEPEAKSAVDVAPAPQKSLVPVEAAVPKKTQAGSDAKTNQAKAAPEKTQAVLSTPTAPATPTTPASFVDFKGNSATRSTPRARIRASKSVLLSKRPGEETTKPSAKRTKTKATSSKTSSKASAKKKEPKRKAERKAPAAKKPAAGKKSNPVILYDGPVTEAEIPQNWTKQTVERQGGKTAGQTDNYWYSPIEKFKFRSKAEIKRFLAKLDELGNEKDAWKAFKGR